MIVRPTSSYINTSVEDCKIDLANVTDLAWLRELRTCLEGMEGHATRRKLVDSRIRQVEKAQRLEGK